MDSLEPLSRDSLKSWDLHVRAFRLRSGHREDTGCHCHSDLKSCIKQEGGQLTMPSLSLPPQTRLTSGDHYRRWCLETTTQFMVTKSSLSSAYPAVTQGVNSEMSILHRVPEASP
jgi:hypothetical protein